MKNNILILLLSIFIVSCTSNTIFKKPENLIPKDQMVDLLVDMQLAIGARSVKNIDGKRNIDYMHLVYEKYGIDSTRFAESNFYYNTDIDQYGEILEKVKTRIDKIKKQYEKEQLIKDSLKRKNSPMINKSSVKKQKKKVFKTQLGTPVKK